jgi:Tfp pilus assembly PilM family ATPase
MFVDLGRATTKLVVLDAGNAVVQRTIAIGGVDIEAGLCKREQEPISRARALRKVEGEDNAYEGEPTVAALADELRLGTRHHHALFPDRELESVVFAGGEAWDEPLCRRLGAALGLTTRIADPLATLARSGRTDASGVDLDQPQPAWAVPLGLCLAPTDA